MSQREMTDILLDIKNESDTARYLGISRSRIRRWKENPESLPLWAMRKLASLKGYQVQITTNHTYT